MALHLQREVEGLKKKLLSLSTLVEENVGQAVRAVADKNEKTAQGVISSDRVIDLLEIGVEEECLKILALHQPVAVDLRFIIAVLKMNNDFERIGDLSVNIAERALALCKRPAIDLTRKLDVMVEKVRIMLKKSLDSLVTMDAALARHVCASDDAVDALYRETYDDVKKGILQNAEQLDDLLQLLSISRHLERIADHATNIAEDVIYMIEGEIFRHNRMEKRN
jgi:phosphate transport system protein